MKRPRLFLIFGVVLLIALVPLVYLITTRPRPATAGWWNPNWQYRKVIPISSHTSAETNEYIAITGYDASDTTKYQSDCGDVRFTKYNGELLPYTVATCGATTTFNVLFDSFPAGAQDIYIYYGNASAPNGFEATAFSTEASSYVIGTVGSEATTTGPVAYWKFDEGQGQTVNDNTTKSNGTLGADSSAASDDPTWIAEDRCVSGKCLQFDGSADYVNVSGSIVGIQSVGFWVKPTTTTASMIALTSGARITASSGTISATGFTSPTIYVNGAVSTTLTANQWNYIEVTTGTAITANAITIGTANAAFTTGFIDDVKFYPYARSAAEVKADYTAGAATLGTPDQKDFLSDGLVGYWKLDESSGNAADSSGNSLTLTNNATTTYVAGKFGNGSEHVPASLQYLNTATTIAGVKTVSFWVNPDVTGNYYIDLDGGTNYISDTGGTLAATGFTSPTIYVNGVVSSAVTANTWQLVTVTTNTAISASAFAIGKIGSNYFDGTFDEVRLYNRPFSPLEVRQLFLYGPGPVGWWKLDEGSANTCAGGTNDSCDSSGNGFDGAWNGDVTTTTGKFNKGTTYDGSGDFIQVTNTTALQITGDLTISAWVNPSSVTGLQELVGKEDYDVEFAFGLSNTDMYFLFGTGFTYNTTYTSSGANIKANTWQLLTVVRDTQQKVERFYKNGIFVTQNSYDFTVASSNNNVLFGRRSATFYPYTGKMDDIRIYNYARTAQQIVEDMQGGAPAGAPNAGRTGSQTAYWSFDEQQGSTANNRISANPTITGSISGATWKTKENCKLNGCLDYDGTDDVTTVTNANAIDLNVNLASGFTASAWIYADTDGEGDVGQIFQKGTTTYCRTDNQSGSNLDVECSLDLATTDATLNVSSAITTGSWNHIAVSYTDDSDDEVTIWVNGVNKGSSTNGSGAPAADTNNLLVGGTTTANFDGKIDEFKLYNSELTQDQMKIDYNLGTGVKYSVGQDEAADLSDGADDPPVGEWDFNEKTGSSANDTSGGGNTGTITNAVWNSSNNCKMGSCLYFDGSGDFVEVSHNSALSPATTVTIEAWIKTTATATQTIVEKEEDASPWDGYELAMNNVTSGKVSFWVGGSAWTTGTTSVNDNKWHHIVATCDGSTAKVYVDGVQDATQAQTCDVADAVDNGTLHIGARFATEERFWTGYIDHVKVYNYVRTAGQVAYDYNRGAPVGWWKLDECQGTTAYDSAGTNNGTITIGASVEDTVGTCQTSSTAWGSGASGKYSASLSLDGSDDYITGSTDIDVTNFTISAWVYRNGGTGTVLAEVNSGATSSSFHFRIGGNSGFYNGTSWQEISASATPVGTGSWKHAALTYDGSNLKYYVDGKLNTSGAASGTPADLNLTPKIGRLGDYSGNYWNGYLDDVRIYNYALSANQIKKVYNEGSAVRFGN